MKTEVAYLIWQLFVVRQQGFLNFAELCVLTVVLTFKDFEM